MSKRRDYARIHKHKSRECMGLTPWGGNLIHYVGKDYDKNNRVLTISVFSPCGALFSEYTSDKCEEITCPKCLRKLRRIE